MGQSEKKLKNPIGTTTMEEADQGIECKCSIFLIYS